jgi:hypothetical protein
MIIKRKAAVLRVFDPKFLCLLLFIFSLMMVLGKALPYRGDVVRNV